MTAKKTPKGGTVKIVRTKKIDAMTKHELAKELDNIIQLMEGTNDPEWIKDIELLARRANELEPTPQMSAFT